ncbi:hypothetical protein GC248_10360, partial [Acetobacter senegalensis]|nr:hypothetical protein [Acetobacter senegalensis]
ARLGSWVIAKTNWYYTNPLELRRVTGHKDIKSLDRYYQPHTEDLAAKAIAYEKRNFSDKD